ncbi:MAG: hypothetical protein ACOC35_08010 [Promethearchaeia archaeon]
MEKLRSNIVRTIPDSGKCNSWKGCLERLTKSIKHNDFYRSLREQVVKNRELPRKLSL